MTLMKISYSESAYSITPYSLWKHTCLSIIPLEAGFWVHFEFYSFVYVFL